MPPAAACDPLFGMDGTALLNLSIITPISNSGSHHHWIDSYRLEENDTACPIRTENVNQSLAVLATAIKTGAKLEL
jgi:hypothetical protein